MKLFFTIASFAIIINSANARVLTVTCQNGTYHFLPVTINAVVGDTVLWNWVSGGHVVGPVNASDIPVGAATFNALIDVTHHTFQYKVTVVGTYNYQCHPATPHGEPGYIVVTAGTGVQQYTRNDLSVAYPNPFSEKVTIETSNANGIIIYNALGSKVRSVALNSGQPKVQIDLTDLNEGIYFYSILKEGVLVEVRKLVKA